MEKKPFLPPQEKTHDIGDASGSFKSVLLLDDESDLSEVLKAYLEEHGFRVTCVKNGVEGLKKIIEQDFDIILCDMMMPQLPGDMFYIAVERVKPQLSKRFVFMTGHKNDKKIDDFIRRVKGLMLFKPFQPHELLEMINVVLRKSSGT